MSNGLVVFPCVRCGCTVVAKSFRGLYCEDCKRWVKNVQQREYKARRRVLAGLE